MLYSIGDLFYVCLLRFAITIGSVGEYESTQDKIKNGFIYKVSIALSRTNFPENSVQLLGQEVSD